MTKFSMSDSLDRPPFSPVEPVTEVLHGIEVTDPYRWLEDQNSARTRHWLKEQADYARAYFDAIPDQKRLRERVADLLALKTTISEPCNVGDRYFFLKCRDGSQQPLIVVRAGLFGAETVLVDPALRQTGPTTSVAIETISADGRFLAYSVRQGGTDHAAVEIFDLTRSSVLPDRLPDGFCNGIAFASDRSGFYYSHRELNESRLNHRAVCWHAFGTQRSEDREVFSFPNDRPNVFLGLLYCPDTNFLVYTVFSTGKGGRISVYLDSRGSEDTPKLLLDGLEDHFVPFIVRGQLMAYTDVSASNFRIVAIDLSNPSPDHWRDIVPESERKIQQFAVAGDRVFVTRIDRFSTMIESFGLGGGRREDISIPAYGTVNLLNRGPKSDKLFLEYTSLSKPSAIFCYDTCDNTLIEWEATHSPVELSPIRVEEVSYRSKDGTSIPLFLASRQGDSHSGPKPTFVTGYGGFGNCVTPRFTAFATFLIEQGFLFAVPALRGGSELGERWHRAGQRECRQNSFDDFIAATEWLQSQGRSTPGRIAIGGGSNAGLLVGAAITQRPDLFRVAICLGPLLDMTRYHLFDFASGWSDEYGLPDDEQDFRFLLAYSPYHRVHSGIEYPAVMLISGDADTRCNPLHARKMTARLQAATSSPYPVLLDYRPTWGHMPVQPRSTKVSALSDRLAFLCQELGVRQSRRFPQCYS
jgi:prolyl oligopeptidase